MFKLITKLVLGTSLFAAFFPPGVPTAPPPVFTPGNVSNEPGTDGQVFTSNGDGTYSFEDAAGGSGLTVTGTPIYGETVGYNDFDDAWVPQKPGAGVFPVKAYGASGRSDISTTGTVTSGTAALTLASATTFAKGNYIAVVGAGATHGIAAPSTPIIADAPRSFTANATSNITTLGATGTIAAGEAVTVSTSNTLPAGLSPGTYYWGWTDTWTTNATSNIVTLGSSQSGLAAGEALKVETTTTLPGGTLAATFYYWTYADVCTVNTGTDVVTTTIAHSGLSNGEPVRFEATTSTPTGLTANTIYYARVATTTTFTMYDTSAHAIAGGATGLVDISTTGSGTIYIVGPDLAANTIGQLYDSSAHALANTNRVDMTDTGTGTHYVTGPDLVGTTLGQLYPTNGDALANTNRIDITDAGTGTHALNGGTTYDRGVGSFSGDGGWSAVSTVGETTTGWATLGSGNYGYVCWRAVSNSDGFYVTGRSSTQANRSVIARINGAANAKMVTFQAGGYTSAIPGDIGKTVTRGTSTGVLAGYDNTNRFWWIIPTTFGTDTFSSFGAATIGSGTGAGTSTAVEDAYAWKDTGDDSAIASTIAAGVESGATVQPSLARRASTVYQPGDIIVHPIGPTGDTFICIHVDSRLGTYGQTSATATGSLTLGSTVGTEYQDGDVFWLCVKLAMPVDEPTVAVPDLLRTQISDISGTSVTMAAVAGNSVASQIVLHDEFAAIDAARTAAMTENAASTVVYFDPGIYFSILGDPDANSGAGTWNQWTATNGPYVWKSTTGRPHQIKLAPNAKWIFLPTTHRSNTVDSGSNDYIFRINAGQMTISGTDQSSAIIMAPMCEPKLIQKDGWNRTYLYGDYATGADQRGTRTVFEDLSIHGFARVGSLSTSTGVGDGPIIRRCKMTWGGAGHDALWYGSVGQMVFNTFIGSAGFGSDVAYTDDEATDFVNDHFEFCFNKIRYSRVNGVRARQGHCTIVGNEWVDSSGDVILCESAFKGVIANNIVTNGGQLSLSGEATLSGNNLTNSRISVGSGKVNIVGGEIIWNTSADSYFSSGSGGLLINGGTSVKVSGLSLTNTETSGADRGVQIVGGTDIAFTGCFIDVLSESALANSSAATLTWTGGTIDTNGATGLTLCSNASANVTMTGVTIRSGGGGAVIANNGNLWFKNNTCFINTNFSSGLDYLECVGNAINKGASGTTTLDVPNAIYQNNTFGSAPSASTQTGVHARGNSIAGVEYVTPSALASGTTDDYGISQVASILRLDPNAANSTITSIVARGPGDVITIYCTDAGAATITIDDAAASGTDANKILTKGGADAVLSNKEHITIMYDGVQSRWVEIGGSY